MKTIKYIIIGGLISVMFLMVVGCKDNKNVVQKRTLTKYTLVNESSKKLLVVSGDSSWKDFKLGKGSKKTVTSSREDKKLVFKLDGNASSSTKSKYDKETKTLTFIDTKTGSSE